MELLSKGDKIINVFFYALLVLLIVICFYPLWYVVVASISDGTYVNSGAFILLPKGIHFAAYEYAFQQQQLWVGYQKPFFTHWAVYCWGFSLAFRARTRCPEEICRDGAS